MVKNLKSKASIPNPALKAFKVFVGEWKITGSHPYFPGTILHGHASFDWLEGGAFLIMRSKIDHPDFPSGIAIFGSDDVAKKYFQLYFDERGISRKYDVAVTGNKIKWWRDESSFSQRFIITIEDGGRKIVGKGKMSRDGAAWEKDIELTFTRATQKVRKNPR